MGANPRVLIPIRSKVAKRFYEPIVLLVGLNMAWIRNQSSKAPDLSLDVAQSSERVFHCFVNKLGQLCDSERGGNTVTAFVVLKYHDRIQYRFASNQRESEDLIRARTFTTYVLQTLGRTDEDEFQGITSHILRKALSFTRPRVESYVKELEKHAAPCMRACVREDTDESRSIIEKLEELRGLLCFSNNTKLDDDTFSEQCEGLIKCIDRLYQSEVDGLIRNKTKEGRMNESEYWCELRHAAGRLLSYLKAVKVLVWTRKHWPELFENFEVCYISSSHPIQNPLRVRTRPEELYTEQIIGRMTSDPAAMASYRARAQELQKFELDENIRKHAGNRKFRPIVHAEVLLLESLEKDGGTHPSRFFNGYKYIGCSKPTCRLCDYYFSVHPSGVEVRPTHRNLYPNWRMPDVYKDQGPQVEKKRENFMNKMLVRIRDDTFRTLNEKLPERKPHDSNTEPTYPIDSLPSRDLEDIEHLAARLKDLDNEFSKHKAIHDSPQAISFSGNKLCALESDDEQDGGVRI